MEKCRRCLKKNAGDSGVCSACQNVMQVREYNYKPAFKILKTADDDSNLDLIERGERDLKFDSFPMGIELEIGRANSKVDRDTQAFRTQLIAPNHFYAKHDGSIGGNGDGYELVSHPFTWLWAKQNREVFEELFIANLKAGYRSYSIHQCGLHVHITKDVFDPKSLEIFLKLFFLNADFWAQFTQKDAATAEHYSSYNYGTQDNLRKTAQTMSNQLPKKKYHAVNVTRNTVELRIFRGSLSPDYFWRDLQAAKISVDFARTGKTPTIATWKKYIISRKKGFPELYRFITSDKTVTPLLGEEDVYHRL